MRLEVDVVEQRRNEHVVGTGDEAEAEDVLFRRDNGTIGDHREPYGHVTEGHGYRVADEDGRHPNIDAVPKDTLRAEHINDVVGCHDAR